VPVPQYDVPYTEAGHPTVKTIIERIQCEIRDLVRPDSKYGGFLRSWDMDVLIALSVEVNNTGALTPSLSYLKALSPLTSFTFSGNFTLGESRDHTFTENLQYSVRQIYLDWYAYNLVEKAGINPMTLGLTAHDCPQADTFLSGTLGIVDFVAMAAGSEGLDTDSTPDKVFGGTIKFLVTKNTNGTGPTWSLIHFKGPGGLLGLSQVNTDQIVLSFAQGPNVGKPIKLPTLAQLTNGFGVPMLHHPPNAKAYWLLQQQLTGSIGSQLTTLQNGLLVTNGQH
jgi:hypothetical protein